MELIAKISKGSKMDQIYIPKNRSGLSIGSYVVIKPLSAEKSTEKPYFYNADGLEPIKVEIVNKAMQIIDNNVPNYDNILITGSFLDKGFNFNDLDVVIISKEKLSDDALRKKLGDALKITVHIITLNSKTLMKGLSTDPLYQMMLSKCIAKKRFVYNVTKKIEYKILDLHLLKSKSLIENFDLLNGNEKYYLTRNLMAIYLFLNNKIIGKDEVDKAILKSFSLKNIDEIKQNMLDKKSFVEAYKKIYKKTFDMVMESINGSEQK